MKKWEKNLVNMVHIEWDPKDIAKRIYKKVDKEIKHNIGRYLETLVNRDAYKIRIGDYRLFVDYYKDRDEIVIRTIAHRKNAYKKS